MDAARFIIDRGVRKAVKACTHCERDMLWRKKWERCWEDVQFCSSRCRTESRRARRRVSHCAEFPVPVPPLLLDSKADRKAKKRLAKQAQRDKRAGTSAATGSHACDQCNAVVDLTIRCTVDASAAWKQVCGRCWRAASGGVADGDAAHPHYNYGGLWKNRR